MECLMIFIRTFMDTTFNGILFQPEKVQEKVNQISTILCSIMFSEK